MARPQPDARRQRHRDGVVGPGRKALGVPTGSCWAAVPPESAGVRPCRAVQTCWTKLRAANGRKKSRPTRRFHRHQEFGFPHTDPATDLARDAANACSPPGNSSTPAGLRECARRSAGPRHHVHCHWGVRSAHASRLPKQSRPTSRSGSRPAAVEYSEECRSYARAPTSRFAPARTWRAARVPDFIFTIGCELSGIRSWIRSARTGAIGLADDRRHGDDKIPETLAARQVLAGANRDVGALA